jgi:lipoprotein-anchoring transpeptidase ErfK/SrfK
VRRILLVVAVALVGSMGVVTAAVAGDRGPTVPAAPPVPAVSLGYGPGVGASEVSPVAPITVTAAHGTLDDVVLTDPAGTRIAGTLDDTRTTWTATDRLDYDTTYTWTGRATGVDGLAVPLSGEFHTVKPSRVVRGVINISDGRTVGIAAPIQIQFDTKVTDRAAVERALSVTTSVPVEGSWAWLPDENGGSRVHWRPKEYWPAGTEVTVDAKLFGVPYGGGAYGRADVTSTFTIGRAQIVRADVTSHRMVVVRDGKQVASYPASYGLSSDANRTTRSGIHVVTEKHREKRMASERYGYDLTVGWAVRISNNGEFIHANAATVGQQGSSNVTHGCINLSPANARAYFDTALYGDPVEVTGSNVDLAPRDGDVWDWTLSWKEWQSLSAL